MKRRLLALPLAAALAGLLLLLWLKRPDSPAASPRPAAPVQPAHPEHAHEHSEEPKTADQKASTAAATGGLLVRVTGRGTPLPNAEVVLVRENPDGRMRFQTGSDGSRLITQIPAGAYSATVQHPRFLPTHAHLTIPAGGQITQVLDLQPGARIFGRVTDRAGNPLQNASATVVDAQNRFNVSSSVTAKTDANGRYEILNVEQGEVGVRFKHEKFKLHEQFGLPPIRTGLEELEVNAALELGARVAGRVLDETGAPIAGAQVLFGNEGGGGISKTDAEGRFTVYGLTDAPVSGSAALKGYGTVYRRGVPPNTLDVEFRLAKGGILAGRLIADPMPEHFTVTLSKYDPELGRQLRFHQKALSFPPQGVFQVEDIAAGTYWVEVECDGYEAGELPQVTVSPGQTTPAVMVPLRKK